MRTTTVLTVLTMLLAADAPAQESATLFRGVRVFDGAAVIPATDVLVREGRIAEVRAGIKAPSGSDVVDGSGRTLLPGLIDAHTHVYGDALREALVFGVTTELDMFTMAAAAQVYRREQREGKASHRADIFSAGTLVTAPGGHGTEYGMEIPTITRAADAQAFVDARIAEGSDWIKIVYDDGGAFSLRWPSIDRATLRAVIDAAHRRNVLAVVHVSTLSSANAALAEGADALVHLFTDNTGDDAFVQLAKSRRAFIIPTLTVLRSISGTPGAGELLQDERLTPWVGPAARTSLGQAFPVRAGNDYAHAQRTVAALHAAGVPILAGTDAPNPGTAHGIAMHRELELLVAAGLTPVQALAAATSVPARHFRIADRGVIRTGARADLLLVEGDPTAELRATRAIAGIWKGGVKVDRDAFRAEVAASLQPPATSAGASLISDFEDGSVNPKFGTPWTLTTDSYAGGTSTGDVAVVDGGANGSAKSLRMTGRITDAVAYAWSGAMWSPGAAPMQPADLSSTTGVTFWTKGDGRTYRVLVFAQGHGMTPLLHDFVAPAEWTQRVVPWSAFGVDGSDIMAVMFVAGAPAGTFSFQVDDVRLH